MKNTDNLFLLKKNDSYERIERNTLPDEIFVAENECFDLIFVSLKESVRLKIILAGPQASCSIKGVYLGAQKNKTSIEIDITHLSPYTQSDQVVRGILTDEAHTCFSGVIRMPQNSQKCQGNQNHRAVLLSDKSQVEAIPELEIYADDVVCSHGSAIGPLDKNQLFYLLSRGIDEKTAYQMLLLAFVCDIVPTKWQSVLTEWFDEHL